MLSIDKAEYSVETSSSFDFNAAEYADLFARSQAHAFQHPIWIDAFFRHLAPNRAATPHVLQIRRIQDGTLQCVVPMILRSKYGLRLLEATDLGVSDYVCPVATPEFWPELERNEPLRQQISIALPRHDLMRIRPVRQEDCRYFGLLFGGAAKPLGFSAHAVPLGRPYDDWRKSALNASLRKMMDRKARKLNREHDVSLEELTNETELTEALVELARLRDGRFEEDVIQQKFAREFYREIAVRGAQKNFASTWRISADGEPMGYVFGLTHESRYYYLLIGCDYDRFGKFSPGLQLYDGIMAHWSERDDAVFDFTIGDEDFKMKFGTSPTPMYGFVRPGSLIGAAAKMALRGLR